MFVDDENGSGEMGKVPPHPLEAGREEVSTSAGAAKGRGHRHRSQVENLAASVQVGPDVMAQFEAVGIVGVEGRPDLGTEVPPSRLPGQQEALGKGSDSSGKHGLVLDDTGRESGGLQGHDGIEVGKVGAAKGLVHSRILTT